MLSVLPAGSENLLLASLCREVKSYRRGALCLATVFFSLILAVCMLRTSFKILSASSCFQILSGLSLGFLSDAL